MKNGRIAGLLILAGMVPGIGPANAESGPDSAAARIEREADSLSAILVPRVAELNGFRESRPVDNEARTKAELREMVGPTAREYYGPDGFAEQRGHPKLVQSSAQSHDADLQRRLWDVSEQLTGVRFPV